MKDLKDNKINYLDKDKDQPKEETTVPSYLYVEVLEENMRLKGAVLELAMQIADLKKK